MTQFQDIYDGLVEPFPPEVVKHRQQAGRQLAYVDARDVAERLDHVVGFENWWANYIPAEHSVQCALTIKFPDGSTVTKIDAGGYAGMQDQGDDDKSGYSDAFKRAAVMWGVGRHLYRDGKTPQRAPQRPQQPAQASAGRREEPRPTQRQQPQEGQQERRQYDGPPRSGKGLFAWTKEQEQKYDVGLLKFLNEWGKLQEFPGRMVDWDSDQVRQAYEEATRKLRTFESQEQPAGVGQDESDGEDIPF